MLSYTQWSEAYDIFMMVHLEEHHSKNVRQLKLLVKDMLTYRKNVTTMMKEGGDWRGYDQHFRKLMESQQVSWATANLNLVWHYNNKKPAQIRQADSASQNNNFAASSQKNCRMFNSRGVRCPHNSRACNYKHACAGCGSLTHPVYMCSNDRATAITQKTPYSSNRAYAAGGNGASHIHVQQPAQYPPRQIDAQRPKLEGNK